MDTINWTLVLWISGIVIGLLLFWGLVGYPQWRVWASHKRGQADLQRARNEQQIQVAEAQGRLDAADLNKMFASAAQLEQERQRQHRELAERLLKKPLPN